MMELIDNKDALADLTDEWNAIAKPFQNPLFRHEWFSAYAEAFGDLDRIMVFVIRSQGEIRAIAPLASVRRAGAKPLRFLGHRLFEPCIPLYTDEGSLQVLLREITRRGYPLRLDKIPAISPVGDLSSTIRPWMGQCFIRPASACASVPLSSDRAAFESHLSASSRYFLRRKWKRAERLGPVAFEALAPREDSAETALRDLFRIEASGWKGRQKTAVLSDPHLERFYMIYGREMAKHGALRVYFLKIGDDIVAGRMTVEFAGRSWELKVAYDERWRDCSPGVLLTHETLCHAGAQGLTGHEFLGDIEPWERMWPIQEMPYVGLRTYPLSIRGAVVLARDFGRHTSRRIASLARQGVSRTWPERAATQ